MKTEIEKKQEDNRRADTMERIWTHYAHAKEKHPYFCDIITSLPKSVVDTHLSIYRATLSEDKNVGAVEMGTLLSCEFFYEAMQAYTQGDIAAVIEECYDTIAVLLRTIDVLEGRQKLGDPETKGENNGRK